LVTTRCKKLRNALGPNLKQAPGKATGGSRVDESGRERIHRYRSAWSYAGSSSLARAGARHIGHLEIEKNRPRGRRYGPESTGAGIKSRRHCAGSGKPLRSKLL